MKLKPHMAALTLGLVISLWHFVWGIFVILGVAKMLMDFVYSIHFLNNPFTVQPFDLAKWVILLVVTFIVGYLFGYIFGVVWNNLHGK